MKGEADVTIEVKSDYTDAGADVADTIDSGITDKLIVVNDVDNTKLGDYAVTYNATDHLATRLPRLSVRCMSSTPQYPS